MHLTKIKLSGFKSFVDPVSIPLQGNLVGIVGPNGCGKSNIIDAVRWVMGESSAKHLRGGTMADVIFNGSSTRKPVGLASVELVFDNSDARIGGEFGTYNTISIRRQVSRDGQSTYFLNGTRCRRRDITDIFLGTGLGSRSYAIIEQGTISRLIEARPDDLRVVIEEAAGISRYNDRRRETETRIRHTRENLDRLNDLREEVSTQIGHLKRQANKAGKYKQYKEEERVVRQELLAMRWHKFSLEIEAHDEQTRASEKALADFQQEARSHEDLLVDAGRKQQSAQQSLNDTQGELYAVGADLGRIEQTIQLARQSREEVEAELKRMRNDKQRAVNNLDEDQNQLTRIRAEIVQLEQSVDCSGRIAESTGRLRQAAEKTRTRQQSGLDAARTELSATRESIEVERSRIGQFRLQQERLNAQLERLNDEARELAADDLQPEIDRLQDQSDGLSDQGTALRQMLETIRAGAEQQKQENRDLNEQLHHLRSERQQCHGKITSLELLQEHAMGKNRDGISDWLERHDLPEISRLAEHLEVESGWETALETVLGVYLEALCIETGEQVFPHLHTLPDESVAVVHHGSSQQPHPGANAGLLAARVQSDWDIQGLLCGIHCATDLEHAREICKSLAAHESVITADGTWLGAGWLYVKRGSDEKTGVLGREKELRELNHLGRELEQRGSELELRLQQGEKLLATTEADLEQARGREQEITAELSEIRTQLTARTTRQEHTRHRQQRLEQEILEQRAQLQSVREESDNSESVLLQASERLDALESRYRDLSAADSRFTETLERIQQTDNEAVQELRGLKSRIEHLNASADMTRKHLQRLQSQHELEVERSGVLTRKLADSEAPLKQNILEKEKCLERREQLEQQLKRERENLQQCEQLNQQMSEHRQRIDQQIESGRSRLEKIRMDAQASRVRAQAISEQIEELGVQVEIVLQALSEDASESAWSEKQEALNARINNLGAVNLAAIEEFEEQSRRLEYLNQQHDDVVESLDTLEQAMAKIDRETRSLFKTTFDRINQGLQIKFPKLFGGGQATLELTDPNLLEAGVNVIARPPGKRNSSIHLLSGGEKALTAVALVFSIFELNPAPFCLLDEVDAPLDDANVGRFSQLIREMSDSVQFIFITHNKVTMETARQLAGVTMKEPGVSRMVAVDIDEAIELAVS